MSNSLKEIAKLVQGRVLGDESTRISTLSAIDAIEPQTLVFADSKEKVKLVEASVAAAILVAPGIEYGNKPLLEVKEPLLAFIALLKHFNPEPVFPAAVHPSAVIASDVKIGSNVYIGPYVCIESGASIGDNCVLKSHIHVGKGVSLGANSTIHPQVTIYDNCQIGKHVIIHASTVIGSDGFGYTFSGGKHQKMPHVGRVIIEDEVEVGANTAIDRAALGATIIGTGTKIDNLVQIAHSVKLGKNNILCGFTGIAGSTTSGDNVIFAANVGVSDHVRIENNVILGARTGVPPNKILKEGLVYLGNPARPKEIAIKHELAVNRIPLIQKNIKKLKEQVSQLLNKDEAL